MGFTEQKPPERKNRKFGDSFKKHVAMCYLEGKATARQLGDKCGVHFQTIINWSNEYVAQKESKKLTILHPMTSEEQREYEALRQQHEALKKELELAQMKAKAYEIMIQLAKEEYGVDILKNSGAKQSGKQNSTIRRQQ